MEITILFGIIIIISLAGCIRLDKSLSELIFLSVMMIVGISYILGIFNLLRYSLLVIFILAIISLIYILYSLKKRGVSVLLYLKDYSLLYCGIILILSIIWFRNSQVIMWDEFTHWALYPKNIFEFDTLAGASLTSTNNGYPPAVTLFQYIISSIRGVYVEADLYRGVFLLSSFALISNINHIKKQKNHKNIIFMIIIIIIPLIIFSDFLVTLYVDALLAILFASLMIRLFCEKISLFNYVFMFVLSSFLILVKEFGLILVGVFYCSLLLDILFIRRKKYIDYFIKHLKSKKINLLIITMCFFLPLITKISWSLYLSQFQTFSQLGALSSSSPLYWKEVSQSFFGAIMGHKFMLGNHDFFQISAFSITIVISVLYVLIAQFSLKKSMKKRFYCFSLFTIMSAVLYASALLFSYLFLFGEGEAKSLASFDRYVSTILLGIAIIFVVVVLVCDAKGYFKSQVPFIIIIIALVLIIPFSAIANKTNDAINVVPRNPLLLEFDRYKAQIESVVGKEEKVYYVSQGDNGARYWITRYMITPIRIQEMLWDVGKNLENKEVVYESGINLFEWSNILEGYDFVFLDNLDEKFVANFSSLFEGEDSIKMKSLYKVVSSNGSIKLELVLTEN